MEIVGKKLIEAPLEKVWGNLNNLNVLQKSIPGCESLTELQENVFKADITAKIGPLKAKFSGKLELLNIKKFESYDIKFEAKSPVAGFSKGTASVVLKNLNDNETELSYSSTFSIGGKLAQIGSRLVDGVAKKLTNDFFEAFIKNHQLDQESSLKDDARKEEKKSANNKSYYIVIVTLIMLLFFYLGSS